jgi:hypothetical protein
MRTTLTSTNITANTTTANLLSGNINEFVTQRSRVTFYFKSSAAGIKMKILASSDVAVDQAEVVAIGTTLAIPDDLFVSFNVAPGTRLAVTATETAGVSTTDLIGAVDVDPF